MALIANTYLKALRSAATSFTLACGVFTKIAFSPHCPNVCLWAQPARGGGVPSPFTTPMLWFRHMQAHGPCTGLVGGR